MKRIFNSRQRDIFGAGYMELANLSLAALFLGQFLGKQGIKWSITLLGILFYLLFSIFSYIVTKDQY